MKDENIDEDDIGRTHQEINGNGEEEEEDKEEDKKEEDQLLENRLINKARTGLFGLSPFGRIQLNSCSLHFISLFVLTN
jgi:hypothetical protein